MIKDIFIGVFFLASCRVFNVLVQRFLSVEEKPSEEIIAPIAQLSSGIYYSQSNLPPCKPLKFIQTF